MSDTQPTVVAFAGRRIDADGAKAVRFPFVNVAAVRTAIGATLERVAPSLLVASAACGADLVALEAAASRGIRVRIVLPFSPARFRATSVVDRPNPEFWGELYDDMIRRAEARGDLIVLDCSEGDASAYSAANDAIVAAAVAASLPATRRIALIAWEGAPRGDDDATKQFADAAERSGFTVLPISTLEPQPVG
jgi:hypothetical protein